MSGTDITQYDAATPSTIVTDSGVLPLVLQHVDDRDLMSVSEVDKASYSAVSGVVGEKSRRQKVILEQIRTNPDI